MRIEASDRKSAYYQSDIAKFLNISVSKVKYLWNGRTDKSGNTTPPMLNFRLDANGRRYSTNADIRMYEKTMYSSCLTT